MHLFFAPFTKLGGLAANRTNPGDGIPNIADGDVGADGDPYGRCLWVSGVALGSQSPGFGEGRSGPVFATQKVAGVVAIAESWLDGRIYSQKQIDF